MNPNSDFYFIFKMMDNFLIWLSASLYCHYTPWAPARGEQGGQAPTLEKIWVGMAHPGNFSRGLKTSWQ